MLNQKLNFNYDKILKWATISSVSLLILALIFKIRTLIIAAELFILILILATIFGTVYSVATKYDNKNKENK